MDAMMTNSPPVQAASAVELDAAMVRAREWERTATPEQKAAMLQAQRESWIRAFAPCEHGDPDWETCPKCRGWDTPDAG